MLCSDDWNSAPNTVSVRWGGRLLFTEWMVYTALYFRDEIGKHFALETFGRTNYIATNNYNVI